jgi:hypothetical protein
MMIFSGGWINRPQTDAESWKSENDAEETPSMETHPGNTKLWHLFGGDYFGEKNLAKTSYQPGFWSNQMEDHGVDRLISICISLLQLYLRRMILGCTWA